MYQLGKESLRKLEGVDPRLVRVVKRAITITTQDFSVHEGVRSLATQRDYVRRGVSQTMNSRHLKQADGFGKAVDLVPYAGGMLRWEWPLIYPMIEAVRLAAIDEDVIVRWGGGWFILNECSSMAAIKRRLDAYVAARRAQKKTAFLDGPHVELPA